MWKSIGLFLLNQAASKLLPELWEFLKASVATMESSDLTGAQKRVAIAADALTRARTIGIAISDSLINLGVEAALQVVRAKAP